MGNPTTPTNTEKNTTVACKYFRFASPSEMKGDSLRRKTEASEAYAAEHGMDIPARHPHLAKIVYGVRHSQDQTLKLHPLEADATGLCDRSGEK